MAQSSGRVTCPRCGANNFETVSVCWKCSTPLNSGANAYSSSTASASSVNNYGGERGMNTPVPPAYMSPPVVSGGDSAVATRAAIALALTFPWIGLPVGWVFMMIEDRQKQAIGRICAVWSMIALVLHLFFMFVFIQGAMASLVSLLPALMKARNGGGGGTDSTPNIPGLGNGQP